MYFPYLRGKQFELIALRELSQCQILDKTKVSPIIEPVKRGLKSIQTALKSLQSLNIQVQLIVNPQYGDLVGKSNDIITFINEQRSQGLTNIIPAFLIHSDNDVNTLITIAEQENYVDSGYSLVHLAPVRRVEELSQFAKNTSCKFNTIHINHVFALRRKFERQAILGDYFRKQRVNADYANEMDEAFSSDCFFFKQEGFEAFSDYQSIGADWIEGGMVPKAVVIHLTYKDQEQEEIRIHHFVSDKNDDTTDIAGKFYEALTKLVSFVDKLNLESVAIRSFKDLYSRQAFPGLGTIKKLSIMHHIELMQSLI